MRAMRACGALLILALCLSACAGAAAGSGTAVPAAQSSEAAPLMLTAGQLTVTIASPENEAVVNAAQVDITGQAPPETVISIDDVIAVVDGSGQFSIPVPLQEGPNELDIVASDPAGNEASARLVVTYEPES